MRDKLISLLCKYAKKKEWILAVADLADHLIANGVTFATDNNVGHKWISVSERLPEAETDVLVFSGGYVSILTYRYDRSGNLKFMYMDDCGYWHERFAPTVTHWIPLPEAPKEGEDNA